MKIKVIEDSFIYKVLGFFMLIPFILVMIIIGIGALLVYPLAVLSAIRNNEKIEDHYNEMLKDFFNMN